MEETKNSNFFHHLGEIEGATACLPGVYNTLVLFEGLLRDESALINPEQPATVEIFTRRLAMFMDLLEIILRELGRITEETDKSIEEAYQAYREAAKATN